MEKIFSGAITIVSILMAIFTWSFNTWTKDDYPYNISYLVLWAMTGLVVVTMGLLAAYVYKKELTVSPNWIDITFIACLILLALTPIFVISAYIIESII